MLHTMYYVDEIRRVEEFRTDTSLIQDRELDLAKTLISALAEDFKPEKYHDTYRENLRRMIDDKVAGRKVVEPPAPKIAPVIDIMEALKRSLSERRKPVQSVSVSDASEAAAVPKEAAAKKRGRSKAS
jgi:DNA end-binding protein Ku